MAVSLCEAKNLENMNIRITGVGVVFIAIAILAFLLIGGGNGVTTFGNAVNLSSVSSSGGSMSAVGIGLVVILVLMGFVVIFLRC
jgi:hypothetical protein